MSNQKIFAAKQHELTVEKQRDLGLVGEEENGRFKRKNRS
jgi:hypothetical protein